MNGASNVCRWVYHQKVVSLLQKGTLLQVISPWQDIWKWSTPREERREGTPNPGKKDEASLRGSQLGRSSRRGAGSSGSLQLTGERKRAGEGHGRGRGGELWRARTLGIPQNPSLFTVSPWLCDKLVSLLLIAGYEEFMFIICLQKQKTPNNDARLRQCTLFSILMTAAEMSPSEDAPVKSVRSGW